MDTEIEFRVWDKQNKKMLNYADILEAENGTLVGDLWINDAPDYELMQYTTNKDRNGTKIFKGDVLRYNDGIKGDLRGEVVWDKDSWTVDGVYLHHVASDAEVIGNVFENKELKEAA